MTKTVMKVVVLLLITSCVGDTQPAAKKGAATAEAKVSPAATKKTLEELRKTANNPKSNKKARAHALVEMGDYYYQKGFYFKAIEVFRQVLQYDDKGLLTDKIQWLIGHCLDQEIKKNGNDSKESYTETAETLIKVYNMKPGPRMEAESLYWAGDSYFKAGDYIKAYETFKKGSWDYPESHFFHHHHRILTEGAFAKIEEEEINKETSGTEDKDQPVKPPKRQR